MRTTKTVCSIRPAIAALGVVTAMLMARPLDAQPVQPTLIDPNLGVRAVASGLTTPVGLAFIGPNDMLVLEKDTGTVKRVRNGVVEPAPVLDLAVNAASERGLLGIALHPQFPSNRGVYLYWTCRTAAPAVDPFFPSQERCETTPGLGADATNVLEVPLLGNRVDRFEWNGSTLVFDRNLIMLRAFQNDAAPAPPDQGDAEQSPAGNHNGGVIRFGRDGRLYIVYGDNGRRGQLQNLERGRRRRPTTTSSAGRHLIART